MTKSEPFTLPTEIRERLLSDDRFGTAYELAGPERRAFFKTCIARLWSWYERSDVAARDISIDWRNGMQSRVLSAPVDYFLLVIDDTVLSPSKVLAALVPALVAGVSEVLVARLGDDWPDDILAALELAGVEQVISTDMDELDEMGGTLLESGAFGAVIALGEGLAFDALSLFDNTASTATWSPAWGDIADVWVDDSEVLDDLATAYPDITFSVYNTSDLPADSFTAMEGDEGVYLEETEEVCFVPNRLLDQLPEYVRLAFGDGMIGSWVWTDLPTSLFLMTSTRLTSGE